MEWKCANTSHNNQNDQDGVLENVYKNAKQISGEQTHASLSSISTTAITFNQFWF